MLLLSAFKDPCNLNKKNYSDLPKGLDIQYECKVRCSKSNLEIISSLKRFESASGSRILIDIDDSKLFYLDNVYVGYNSGSCNFECMIDLKKSFNYLSIINDLIKNKTIPNYKLNAYIGYWRDCFKVLLSRYDPSHYSYLR